MKVLYSIFNICFKTYYVYTKFKIICKDKEWNRFNTTPTFPVILSYIIVKFCNSKRDKM